jgi:hypothetical protein
MLTTKRLTLSDRVYSLAHASHASANAGNSLTTSETPGWCTRVAAHAKPQGAGIEKAMGSLVSGPGMVFDPGKSPVRQF